VVLVKFCLDRCLPIGLLRLAFSKLNSERPFFMSRISVYKGMIFFIPGLIAKEFRIFKQKSDPDFYFLGSRGNLMDYFSSKKDFGFKSDV
jgi:hypothetical protein